jgi:hypothetical protein
LDFPDEWKFGFLTSATRPDVDFPKIGVYVRTKSQLSQQFLDCKHPLKQVKLSSPAVATIAQLGHVALWH